MGDPSRLSLGYRGSPPPVRAVPGGGGGMPAGRAPSPSDGRRRQPGGTPVGEAGWEPGNGRTDGQADGQDRQTDRGSLAAASRHPDVRELGWGAVGQAGRARHSGQGGREKEFSCRKWIFLPLTGARAAGRRPKMSRE